MIGLAAGELRYRVTIQRYTVANDPLGGEVKTWADLAVRWSDISFGTGRERREAAQEVASVPATFLMRRDSVTATITPADRLRYDGVDWDITSVVPSRKYAAALDITAVRRAG